MIPTGRLALECAMINPPKPLGCIVLVDDKPVAVLTIESVKEMARLIERREAERS